MTFHHRHRHWALALLMTAMVALQGCEQKPAESTRASTSPATAQAAQPAYQPVTVEHKLGTTVVEKLPQRVVALDMNEVDFLDQLGVSVAGMPKDFVPHFLARYKDAPQVEDTGAIVQPNLERVHAAKPDLILITSLQAKHYKELSEIAPTIHFDVDYRDSQVKHIEVIKDHLITLGRIFGKEDLARQKSAELDAKVEEARRITQSSPEKALIVLHNNGAFSSFGVQSRYGFVFNALGVTPASPTVETGLHGQPVSSEFIQQANPGVIYIVDRTAVMERRPGLNAENLGNPLLRQTNAWKNGRVVFADSEAWYITAASPTSLKLVIDDVIKGYQN
ncbi:iron(III) dicitrate transport system periplasmic iron-binding protein FecB [Klebsiella pneumoniae]|uniref:Iron(III) dicitrate transport system periplasmic iron-binding protein FecB n=1 Tax=Klebsiella pneumoniae TaxID=573 RepID=A0AB74GRD7_KLEPN|nr:iron(III) dicitrate transport system periplasmic iron-binding protein FecB [Klebsiella pneumoniae]STU31065.1 iron(III) dicitrate transport system periplasmic iron-binding protein FecB [Klebsiella pneumoniae]STU50866.1 iron(III) dicitrate transport system periplasmic iron-binding protein FecB [Klebsiella pneumoniae]